MTKIDVNVTQNDKTTFLDDTKPLERVRRERRAVTHLFNTLQSTALFIYAQQADG